MHDSVMKFLREHLSGVDVLGKTVLEVGARNVNGSAREVIEPMRPLRYIGIDAEAGPGVDVVLRAEEICSIKAVELEPRLLTRFDLVVSTEMLEHCEDWRGAISCMKRHVGAEGVLIVTTRSPGFPRHEHPGDYWRFTVEDFVRIFADMNLVALQSDPKPGHPGVFLKARPKPGYSDAVDLIQIEVEKAPSA